MGDFGVWGENLELHGIKNKINHFTERKVVVYLLTNHGKMISMESEKMSWESNVRKVVPYVPGEQPNKNNMIK